MKIVVVLNIMLWTHLVLAQEESFPCENINPDLHSLFGLETNGGLDYLYIHECSGLGLDGLTTSFLRPPGPPPKIKETEWETDDSEYVEWTCRYSPGMIQDNDPSTAWVEGEEGYGEGQIVLVPCLDLQAPVEIWAGYGKSQDLFLSNSRPKTIDLAVVRAQFDAASQFGNSYSNISVVSRSEVVLKDLNEFQPLPIPKFDVRSDSDNDERFDYFLAIMLIDAYPGSKWKDVCISEIKNSR